MNSNNIVIYLKIYIFIYIHTSFTIYAGLKFFATLFFFNKLLRLWSCFLKVRSVSRTCAHLPIVYVTYIIDKCAICIRNAFAPLSLSLSHTHTHTLSRFLPLSLLPSPFLFLSCCDNTQCANIVTTFCCLMIKISTKNTVFIL